MVSSMPASKSAGNALGKLYVALLPGDITNITPISYVSRQVAGHISVDLFCNLFSCLGVLRSSCDPPAEALLKRDEHIDVNY